MAYTYVRLMCWMHYDIFKCEDYACMADTDATENINDDQWHYCWFPSH